MTLRELNIKLTPFTGVTSELKLLPRLKFKTMDFLVMNPHGSAKLVVEAASQSAGKAGLSVIIKWQYYYVSVFFLLHIVTKIMRMLNAY